MIRERRYYVQRRLVEKEGAVVEYLEQADHFIREWHILPAAGSERTRGPLPPPYSAVGVSDHVAAP